MPSSAAPSARRRFAPRLLPTPAAADRQEAWTRDAIRWALTLLAFFANSNFHERMIPGGEDSVAQQVIILLMWSTIIVLSFLRRPVLAIDWTPGLWMSVLFYALAVISCLWTQDYVGVSKSIAMTTSLLGAWRLTVSLPFDDIVECALNALMALSLASIGLALAVPDIGVLSDFQHPGQWNGIFITKQALGIAAAVQLFLAAYRLLTTRRRRAYYVSVALAAIVCALGAGSRGGGALAIVSVLCVFMTGRSVGFARTLAFAPTLMALVGVWLIWYMTTTGYAYIYAFDTAIDFTERTFIWQHALAHFSNAPWFGYGLNGFWGLKEVKDVFLEHHGWFLGNFHDGYIAIVMETGVVGLFIFIVSYLFYAARIQAQIDRSGELSRDIAFSLVFTCMIFFIDFTETYFLRSTNMLATFLMINIFIAFRKLPARTAPPGPRRRLA